MLIETARKILGYEKEEIPNGTANGEIKPLVFRDAVVAALNNFVSGEVPSAEEKATIGRLSYALYAGPTVELTVEEAAFIKERSGKVSSPVVYVNICSIIENAAQLGEPESTEVKLTQVQ